ncbi:hypothetical protein CK203_005142 [Vitis vinifera]|uniref:Uncharacterized protein n=1 Tax=Vitis vinifera TaxID=29760 RepID=A0A438KE46_VITVI|nr:hypothetical protein CK203_005142 [Vitis vinifera]
MALLWVRDSGHVSGGLGCCCSCAMCATRTKLPAIDNRCSALLIPLVPVELGGMLKATQQAPAYQHHCTFCWRLKHFSSCCTISGPSFL